MMSYDIIIIVTFQITKRYTGTKSAFSRRLVSWRVALKTASEKKKEMEVWHGQRMNGSLSRATFLLTVVLFRRVMHCCALKQTQPLEQAKPPCMSIVEGWCFSYFKSDVLTDQIP